MHCDLLWASSLGLSLAFISSSNSADMGIETYNKHMIALLLFHFKTFTVALSRVKVWLPHSGAFCETPLSVSVCCRTPQTHLGLRWQQVHLFSFYHGKRKEKFSCLSACNDAKGTKKRNYDLQKLPFPSRLGIYFESRNCNKHIFPHSNLDRS